MDADDRAAFEHAMRIIAHKVPEAVDYVVSYEVLAQVIDTIDALAERIAALQEALGGPQGGKRRPAAEIAPGAILIP
jgi:hypothetical protein